MAIVKANPFGELSGSVGANVFQRSASGKEVVRKKVTPTNPQTLAQRSARTNFSASSSAYKALVSTSKALWNSFAASVGVKQGRWEFVRRYKELQTSNQLLATAGTGLLPLTQVPYDPVALLNTPNSVVADFLIKSGTANGVGLTFTGMAFSATNGTITFTAKLNDTTKNMTALTNAAGRSIGILFEILVAKGQSKYKQSFVSLSSLTIGTAAAQITVTGCKNSIARSNYKYSPIVNDTVTINTYLIDPGANFTRILYQTDVVTAS